MTGKSLFPFALLSSALVAQQLVLPDDHHLCKSPNQLGNLGSTSWWRTAGGRFQILYEARHFTTKAGVGDAIMIDKLMFRGEDGEPNRGTQSWNGVLVQLGVTTLSAPGLSATFATNQLPVFPDTTTMGPVSTHTVTVLPSAGSTPNDYNIVIDLQAALASFPYDPFAAQANLLIDVTLPFAATVPPTVGNVMAIQDTTGNAVSIGGRGVTSAVWNGAAGNLLNPPVVGIEFSGEPGGYNPPIPARNEYFGAACGGQPSSFYQSFLNGQAFDLAGCSLTLTPDVPPPALPNFYTVTKGPAGINYAALNAVPDSTLDDSLVTHPLGFTFRHPGGPAAGTVSIKACTNGFVWLDPAMTGTDFTPSVGELLGTVGTATARLAPLWYDLHCGRNAPTDGPLAGMHVQTFGPPLLQTCCVTWYRVGVHDSVSGLTVGRHAVYDLQCMIHEASGVVEFHYGAGSLSPAFCANTTTTNGTHPAIVGFSVGLLNGPAAVDPQSRDLSHEVPFDTQGEGLTGNMGLTSYAFSGLGGVSYGGRMVGGDTIGWQVVNVPAGSMAGVLLLDVMANQPGVHLPFLMAPGCVLSTGFSPIAFGIDMSPAGTQVSSASLFIPHGYEGLEIYAQYLTIGPTGGHINATSNAIKHTVGLR